MKFFGKFEFEPEKSLLNFGRSWIGLAHLLVAVNDTMVVCVLLTAL